MALANRFAATTALAAAFSLLATPVSAAGLPRAAAGPVAYDSAAETVQDRRWDRHRRHHGDGIDAGDVLAGVLILGGIAAIAGAASRSEREQRYPPPPPPYPDERQDYRSDDGRGIDNAVGMCVDAIERGPDRVRTVDSAARTGEGWTVAGSLERGAGFTCRIDNDGRIRDIDLGGPPDYAPQADDGQYSDDYYARARAGLESAAPHDDESPPEWVADRPEWHGDEGGARPGG